MAEPAVTVVRCRACRQSDRLTVSEGRFWCAWCQRWAEVDTQRVVDARIVLDGDEFRLAPVARAGDWLQPLRVPPGWLIQWNTLAEEDLDPVREYEAVGGTRNLFHATCEPLRRVIDVEYRSEPGQPAVGGYRLRLLPILDPSQEQQQRRDVAHHAAEWDHPVHEFATASRLALVAELEACLRGERG